MAINFLGRKDGEEEKPTERPVEMHIPTEEEKESARQAKRKEEERKKEAEKEAKDKTEQQKDQVDLAQKYLRRRRLIRRSLIGIVSVLIIFGGTVGSYFLYQTYLDRPPSQTVTPPQQPPQQPTQQPPVVAEPEEPVTPPPTEQPTEPGEQPPTALAPLRGALVTFDGSDDVFLVENNGEIRLVDKQNVIFDNGNAYTQINPSLIYRLPERWSEIRRGEEMVTGQVDFDPRILTISELRPFL